MSSIGGYFGLEINESEEFYKEAIRLNSGRNALEYIFKIKEYKKIFIPFFTCDVLLEPIKKLGLEYEFYYIDNSLEPIFDFESIKKSDVFLYTNYFGLKDVFINKLVLKCTNLIIDNAQSFFSKPKEGVDTFYSPRKFFGVSDGAYLFTNSTIEIKLNKDVSFERFSHLLKRIDLSAEEGYEDYSKNDKNLKLNPILEMSNLTQKLLSSIDYHQVANKRIQNFNFLHSQLQKLNKLSFSLNEFQVPMVYPFWTDDKSLKPKLLKSKVYCATYWPNVLNWVSEDCLEYKLSSEVIFIPIDQRYNELTMKMILNLILE